jgi:hypothetical protein
MTINHGHCIGITRCLIEKVAFSYDELATLKTEHWPILKSLLDSYIPSGA